MQIVNVMYIVLGEFAKFESRSVKRNFSTSVLNGLHDLHDIWTFGYYGSQSIVMAERECSNTAEYHQTFTTNRIHEALVWAQYT